MQGCQGFLLLLVRQKVTQNYLVNKRFYMPDRVYRLYKNKNIVFLLDIYVIRRYNSKQQKPIKQIGK